MTETMDTAAEPLRIKDFEQGMTYVRFIDAGPQKENARRVIFTFGEKSSKGEVKTANAIRSDDKWFKEEMELECNGFHCRKTTVNEEVWLEECVKAKKWMTLEDALAAFMGRFKQDEPKKSFRIGYIDNHGMSKSRRVDADTQDEAIAKIPDFAEFTYATAL